MNRIGFTLLVILISTFSLIGQNDNSRKVDGDIDVDEIQNVSDSVTVTVIVQFDINPDGELENVKEKRVKCKSCKKEKKKQLKKEAIEIVESTPNFEVPRDKKGKRVRFKMPIKFKIEKP